ncbi:MAG: hypothetical protein HY698_21105 [Deltaproteobacteria bacterium]|nr:hypothetical protein [Deltaproteobacteria bacterium]
MKRTAGGPAVLLGTLAATGMCCTFDPSGIPGATENSIHGIDASNPDNAADAGVAPVDASTPEEPPGTTWAELAGVEVDGSFGEWASAAWTVFDHRTAAHADLYSRSYSPSVRVQFAARSSSSELFLAFIVSDNDVVVDSDRIWDDDSIEVYLDLAGDASGLYGDDDHLLILRADGRCLSALRQFPTVKCVAVPWSSGYGIEASVSWEELRAGYSPGKTIGFGVGVNDDDRLPTDRDAQSPVDAYYGWFDSSRQPCKECCRDWEHPEPWCDTSRLGTLILSR